ncbi:hypothetical protein M5D96_002166 [Drosophila gunungcola]|uniref:Uncharacterized protein n=1 Tax=Drosophila gunungcola TaxID=103775 RepID=A0A9P9YZV1_9MUSC|nr:hypothetical protein M5D96_002166 [Drosophila gunungcola]
MVLQLNRYACDKLNILSGQHPFATALRPLFPEGPGLI